MTFISKIIAGDNTLYGLDNNNEAFMYDPAKGGWLDLGHDDKGARVTASPQSIAVNVNNLCIIHSVTQEVYQYERGHWTTLPGKKASLITAGNGNVFIYGTDGGLYTWRNNAWAWCGEAVNAMAASSPGKFMVIHSPEPHTIWEVDTNVDPAGAECIWTANSATQVYSNGDVTYMVDNAQLNNIMMYEGTPDKWLRVGDGCVDLAITTGKEFAVVSDQPGNEGTVWKVNAAIVPATAECISYATRNAIGVAATGKDLFRLDKDGTTWQYQGQPNSWTQLKSALTNA